MSKMVQSAIGAAIILLGLFLPQIKENVPNFINTEPSIRQVLNIAKPDVEFLPKGKTMRTVITDSKDQGQFAVFSNEAAKRVPSYNIDSEVFANIISSAGKEVFGQTLNTKYGGKVGTTMQEDLKTVHKDKVIKLNDETKQKISQIYNSYAWTLGGEDEE